MTQMFVAHSIYQEFVEENLHKSRYKFAKNFCNRPLKVVNDVFRPNIITTMTNTPHICDERSFLLVIQVHAYLIVSAKAIQETVHIMSCDRV